MWLVKWRDWYSGVRAIGPEYGRLYRFGLITYVYYACKLRGLSAFYGERDSLLRCVGGDGEAGASYVGGGGVRGIPVQRSCLFLIFRSLFSLQIISRSLFWEHSPFTVLSNNYSLFTVLR